MVNKNKKQNSFFKEYRTVGPARNSQVEQAKKEMIVPFKFYSVKSAVHWRASNYAFYVFTSEFLYISSCCQWGPVTYGWYICDHSSVFSSSSLLIRNLSKVKVYRFWMSFGLSYMLLGFREQIPRFILPIQYTVLLLSTFLNIFQVFKAVE